MKKRTLYLMAAFIISIAMLGVLSSKKKPVRVYVDVCADLYHAGHAEFFKKAKEQGDILVVGIIPDEVVASYKRTPVMTHDERLKAVASCKYVDEVLPHCPLGITEEWIVQHDIDLVVHGDDFNMEMSAAQYQPAIDRGIFRLVPYTSGISTTDVIGRIISQHEKDPFAFVKKDFYEGTEAGLKSVN